MAELTTGPKFNQVATAVITMMTATKIRMFMANLRAVIGWFPFFPRTDLPVCIRHESGSLHDLSNAENEPCAAAT